MATLPQSTDTSPHSHVKKYLSNITCLGGFYPYLQFFSSVTGSSSLLLANGVHDGKPTASLHYQISKWTILIQMPKNLAMKANN